MEFKEFCRQWIIKNISLDSRQTGLIKVQLASIVETIDNTALPSKIIPILCRMLTDYQRNPNFYEEIK